MTQEEFCKTIESIKSLGIIKSVAWDVISDNPSFGCDYSWVRFEDENEFVLKIPLEGEEKIESYYPSRILINLALQKVFQQLGESVNDHWIIADVDVKKAIDRARKLKPYTGNRIPNKELADIGYQTHEYIF